MASCHLKTGLLLSNKQTYPSPGLIGLIKERPLTAFPWSTAKKGNFEMLSEDRGRGREGGKLESVMVSDISQICASYPG